MANVSKRIPSNTQPTWIADINGKRYEYQSGSTETVPEEVAALIDDAEAGRATEDPRASQRGIEKDVTQIVKDSFAGGVGFEEPTEVVMLPETSFEIVAGNPGALISDSFSYTLEVGQDYTVTLDGETKTCTAIKAKSGVYLTNTSLNDAKSGNGWVIMTPDGEVRLQTSDPSLVGAHTISISGSVHEVHKIDRKFIADMPLYEKSGVLFADYNGSALEPNELAELLKTKHCYITKPLVQETRMEILSYAVYRTNNVVDAVKCYFIDSSTGTISSTQNGEIQGS